MQEGQHITTYDVMGTVDKAVEDAKETGKSLEIPYDIPYKTHPSFWNICIYDFDDEPEDPKEDSVALESAVDEFFARNPDLK